VDSNQLVIIGETHTGEWHRHISLLAQENMEQIGTIADAKFPPGTFAENITICGIELHKTSILDRFESEDVILEVTQIVKKCHAKCKFGRMMGNCIMPLEGIFCRVIKGSDIIPGDMFI